MGSILSEAKLAADGGKTHSYSKKATLDRENPELLNRPPTAGSLTGWPSEADIFAPNPLQG
jgi:hypothetical protein